MKYGFIGELLEELDDLTEARPGRDIKKMSVKELNALIDNWMGVMNDVSSPSALRMLQSRIKEIQAELKQRKKR